MSGWITFVQRTRQCECPGKARRPPDRKSGEIVKIRTARSTDPTCLPCQARVQEVAAATPSVRGYEDREPEPCRAGPVAPRPAAECRDGPAAPASIAAYAHVCRLPTRGVVRRGGLGVTRRAATPRRPSPRPACPTGHLLPVLQVLPSGDPKEGPLKEDLVLEVSPAPQTSQTTPYPRTKTCPQDTRTH